MPGWCTRPGVESMSDWLSYREGLSPEYKFLSGVPDFQNSVGAANAKIGRIKRTCIKGNKQCAQNRPQLFAGKIILFSCLFKGFAK